MKKRKHKNEYEYRVYSNGCLAGFYTTRKDAEQKLSICRYDDKHACIQVVCYEYYNDGFIRRIGYGFTRKEALADLSFF